MLIVYKWRRISQDIRVCNPNLYTYELVWRRLHIPTDPFSKHEDLLVDRRCTFRDQTTCVSQRMTGHGLVVLLEIFRCNIFIHLYHFRATCETVSSVRSSGFQIKVTSARTRCNSRLHQESWTGTPHFKSKCHENVAVRLTDKFLKTT